MSPCDVASSFIRVHRYIPQGFVAHASSHWQKLAWDQVSPILASLHEAQNRPQKTSDPTGRAPHVSSSALPNQPSMGGCSMRAWICSRFLPVKRQFLRLMYKKKSHLFVILLVCTLWISSEDGSTVTHQVETVKVNLMNFPFLNGRRLENVY